MAVVAEQAKGAEVRDVEVTGQVRRSPAFRTSWRCGPWRREVHAEFTAEEFRKLLWRGSRRTSAWSWRRLLAPAASGGRRRRERHAYAGASQESVGGGKRQRWLSHRR